MSIPIHRITVFQNPTLLTHPPTALKTLIKNLQNKNLPVKKALKLNSYLIKSSHPIYTKTLLNSIAKELLAHPLAQTFLIGNINPASLSYNIGVEIGYKPTVTDNVGATFLKSLKDYFYTTKNAETAEEILRETQTHALKTYLFKLEEKFPEHIAIQILQEFAQENLSNRLVENCAILHSPTPNPTHFFPTNIYFLKNELKQNPLHHYETIPIFSPLAASLEKKKNYLKKLAEKYSLPLTIPELLAIQKYFAKKTTQKLRKEMDLPTSPTNVEMEVLAQTWSEHCKHKIFNAKIHYENQYGKKQTVNSLFKTYLQKTTEKINAKRNDLLSVFKDNAGIWTFNDDYAVSMKVETHNSPSALDPFGGALTGIVGVNRDIIGTGIGMEPLFNTNVFCFAPPNFKNPLPDKLLPPNRIIQGVHQGVMHGGNHSGIPTVNGAMVFDASFIAKPLVFCGTGGFAKRKINGKNIHDKPLEPGDWIAMTGGRVGRDGLRGATFSSAVLKENAPASAVQIGSPITQKNMLDFLIQARNKGLYKTLTDNGAGGLSSSVGEMAQSCNGAELFLEKVPLKTQNMSPWEILLSESQERMTLAVDPEKVAELKRLAEIYDCEISFIGKFVDSGNFSVSYHDTIICCLPIHFLHQGVPQLQLNAEWNPDTWKKLYPKTRFKKKLSPAKNQLDAIPQKEVGAILIKLLQRPNITSKETWVRQYDHEVKGATILKPFDGPEKNAPLDAAVLKPLPHSYEGIAISNGILPRYSMIDAYAMASGAIDEAVRNLVAVGADPATIVGLDNFSWPDPVENPDDLKENPHARYKLAQLVRACQAVKDICTPYLLPLVSGKDSMKNDFGSGKNRLSVLPTMLFTTLAKVSDIRKTITSFFKKPDSKIYIIGNSYQELGASEFYAELGYIGETVPVVRPKTNLKLYHRIYSAIQKELLLACHDLSDGGLAVALSESAFGGKHGAEIHLKSLPLKNIHTKTIEKNSQTIDLEKLFSESHGRFLVEVSPNKSNAFENLFKNTACYKIGNTIKNPKLIVQNSREKTLIDEPLHILQKAFQKGIQI